MIFNQIAAGGGVPVNTEEKAVVFTEDCEDTPRLATFSSFSCEDMEWTCTSGNYGIIFAHASTDGDKLFIVEVRKSSSQGTYGHRWAILDVSNGYGNRTYISGPTANSVFDGCTEADDFRVMSNGKIAFIADGTVGVININWTAGTITVDTHTIVASAADAYTQYGYPEFMHVANDKIVLIRLTQPSYPMVWVYFVPVSGGTIGDVTSISVDAHNLLDADFINNSANTWGISGQALSVSDDVYVISLRVYYYNYYAQYADTVYATAVISAPEGGSITLVSQLTDDSYMYGFHDLGSPPTGVTPSVGRWAVGLRTSGSFSFVRAVRYQNGTVTWGAEQEMGIISSDLFLNNDTIVDVAGPSKKESNLTNPVVIAKAYKFDVDSSGNLLVQTSDHGITTVDKFIGMFDYTGVGNDSVSPENVNAFQQGDRLCVLISGNQYYGNNSPQNWYTDRFGNAHYYVSLDCDLYYGEDMGATATAGIVTQPGQKGFASNQLVQTSD